MTDELEQLCQRVGYHFSNQALLMEALTHRSAGSPNNERLEFLGDSLLNFIIAARLYEIYPQLAEGELSRLRANMVCGETLAGIAKELMINKCFHMGQGEIRSGGADRQSILANALEAIIGAIYLDTDIERCRERVLSWYATRMDAINEKGVQKDPKTVLQEYLQSQKLPLPEYKITEITGKAHTQIFHVECSVQGLPHVGLGNGTSRRRAEQDSAEKFLQHLKYP